MKTRLQQFSATLLLALLVSGPALAQTPVTFQLDASNLFEKCQLGPNSPYADVEITARGSFNNYQGTDPLSDEDGDGIYTMTLDLEPGDYDFKYHHSELEWEDNVPGSTHSDGNRQFTVGDEALTLEPATFFKNKIVDICDADVQCVDAHFEVNMGPQLAAEIFHPAINLVTVAGPHAGWSTMADTLTADPSRPEIYSTVVTIENQAVPGEIEYKFVKGDRGEDPTGWEDIDGNRFMQVTGDETDIDGNGCIDVFAEPIPFFSDAGWENSFETDALVTVEVDMRPAYYYLADSSYVPGGTENVPVDRLEDFSSVYINGPITGEWVTNWSPTGLGALIERQLFDDGTNGDAVAGDSIYTWQTEMPAGTSRRQTFKLSLDGYDNENASGADHRILLPEGEESGVSVVFGAAEQADGTYESTLYYPYIEIVDGEPVVVRRGGDVGTGVEVVDTELPETSTLGANYPNPFNPTTTFEYQIREAGHVLITVTDLTGREVARLVDDVQPAGTYNVRFDAESLASGVYLYQLRAAGVTHTRKMTLLR